MGVKESCKHILADNMAYDYSQFWHLIVVVTNHLYLFLKKRMGTFYNEHVFILPF